VLAAVAALAPLSAAQAAVTAASGIQIRAAHSNKCFNVSGGSVANSAKIVQYSCSPTATNDKFQLLRQTDGSYWIQGVGSGKCLNVQGGSLADNAAIIQYTCSSSANTKFRVEPVAGKPTVRIRGVQSGKCLNVPNASTADNVGLIQYTCTTTGATNEQFYLPPAVSGAAVPVPYVVYPGVSAIQTAAPDNSKAPVTITYTDRDSLTHVSTFFNLQKNHVNPPSTVSYGFSGTAGPSKVALLGDGRFRVLGHDAASGDFSITDESAPGAGTVTSGLLDIGGGSAQNPVIGPSGPGRLAAYAVIGGALWYGPDQGGVPVPGAWRSLGGAGLVGPPAVIATATGARVFVLTASGSMVTATLEDSTLSDWTDLGGSGMGGTPAAVSIAGLAQVFARASDGTVVSKRQDVNGNFPAAWSATTKPNYKVIGSPSATVEKVNNRIALVVQDEAHIPYLSYLDASGAFTGWTQIATATSEYGASLSDPIVFSYYDPWAGGTKGYAVLYQDLTYLIIQFFNAPTLANAKAKVTTAPKAVSTTTLPKVTDIPMPVQ
jgi:hypothetical protein